MCRSCFYVGLEAEKYVTGAVGSSTRGLIHLQVVGSWQLQVWLHSTNLSWMPSAFLMPKRWLRPGFADVRLSQWEIHNNGKSLGIMLFIAFRGFVKQKNQAMHMLMTTLLSLLLYTVAPSLYPSMDKARENWRTDTWRMTIGDLSRGRYPEGGYGSIPMWVTGPNTSLRLTSLLGFQCLKFKD